ncbi:MAG: helix-turn-helix transcriptional regulator [Verrucomicrobiales bacterium]|nr:helix-turn-helix transcriptional regulator [Verrucomicrobiales bacterium]
MGAPEKEPSTAGSGEFCGLESAAWAGVGAGWRPLYGSFHRWGFSFEWHDFQAADEGVDWGASFHPDSLEICFNRMGEATVTGEQGAVQFAADTLGFYVPGREGLAAIRGGGRRHQFLTLELDRGFVRHHAGDHRDALHPVVQGFLEEGSESVAAGGVSEVRRLTPGQVDLIRWLRSPPVGEAARRAWYEARALDVVAELCFVVREPVLFCERQHRLQRDRITEAISILKRRLADPPGLDELAREIGVSGCYLSRTFSREMGISLSQYLRRLRLERAAELLRSGEYNVTEAAFEVGYNSLSHFSTSFHEMFGVCPGLYPILRQGNGPDLGRTAR